MFAGSLNKAKCFHGRGRTHGPERSRREVLARSRGLSENRYDSFSFGRAIAIARVALKKWGSSRSSGTTAEWSGECVYFSSPL